MIKVTVDLIFEDKVFVNDGLSLTLLDGQMGKLRFKKFIMDDSANERDRRYCFLIGMKEDKE